MKTPHTFLGAVVASVALSTGAVAQTDNDRLDQLEQQVSSLQQQLTKPDEQKIRFNGFFSAGVTFADNDADYAGAVEETNVNALSLFGLQGAFSLDADTDVVMQLVARGADEWEPTMEWAYISHKVTNNFTARAGKLRMPLYMYSDSLDVGYAQPWARPPFEVYGEIPLFNHTGVDAIYEWQLDNSSITTQAFYGHSKEKDLDLRNIRGAEVVWSDFVWKLRANYGAADVLAGATSSAAEFYGLGFSYNDGTWQLVSELTQTKAESVLPDVRSAYVTLARRFSSITPYVTLSQVESTDDDLRLLSRTDAFAAFATPGSPFFGDQNIFVASEMTNEKRDAVSLGLRWDAIRNVAVKFDVTFTDSFGDTGGGLPGNNAPMVVYDDTTVYTVKIDSAF